MTDMFLLVYCQGEYEDYFESPTHMFTDMMSVKQQWEELIAKSAAEDIEYQFLTSKLQELDEYELNKLYGQVVSNEEISFDDFLDNPTDYPKILALFPLEQQEMFFQYQVINARYEQLGGFSREYDNGHFKVDHYGIQPDGSLFLHDTFYNIGDIPC